MSVLDFLFKREPESLPQPSWEVTRLHQVKSELARTTAELETVDEALSAEFFGGGPDPRIMALLSNIESLRITGDIARFRFLSLQREALAAKRIRLANEHRDLLVVGG